MSVNWGVLDSPQYRVAHSALLIEAYIELMVTAFLSPERGVVFWITATMVVVLFMGMWAILMRPCFAEFARLRAERRELRDFFRKYE